MKIIWSYRLILSLLCIYFPIMYPMQSTNQEYLHLKNENMQLQHKYDQLVRENLKFRKSIANQRQDMGIKVEQAKKGHHGKVGKLEKRLDDAHRAMVPYWPDIQKELESESFKAQINSCLLVGEFDAEVCQTVSTFFKIAIRAAFEMKNNEAIAYIKSYGDTYILPITTKQWEKIFLQWNLEPEEAKQNAEEDAKEKLEWDFGIVEAEINESKNRLNAMPITEVMRPPHKTYISLKNELMKLQSEYDQSEGKLQKETNQLWHPLREKTKKSDDTFYKAKSEIAMAISEVCKALMPFWLEIKKDLESESFKQQISTCDNGCFAALDFWITALAVAFKTKDSTTIDYIKHYSYTYILPIKEKEMTAEGFSKNKAKKVLDNLFANAAREDLPVTYEYSHSF